MSTPFIKSQKKKLPSGKLNPIKTRKFSFRKTQARSIMHRENDIESNKTQSDGKNENTKNCYDK